MGSNNCRSIKIFIHLLPPGANGVNPDGRAMNAITQDGRFYSAKASCLFYFRAELSTMATWRNDGYDKSVDDIFLCSQPTTIS